ncbi:SPOR domain-containing protein [Viridibacterium curvum]|uniref:SPOR domain-containing protein n=1 Tax=Viridibacterium curvum TaxID=1101404 RepID=A0ABP9QG87_9RHOO
MAENDAQLELKKRARRRLIGAVALALAAIIFLPMVMDSEPRQTGNELQIRIPSQEGSNFTSRVINTASSSTPVSVPGDPEMSPVTVSSAPRGAASASTVAASSAASSSSSVAAASAPSHTAASSAGGEVRARALLERGEEPASRFFVQVGVYREQDNARGVAAKVKQAGMVPSVEKVGASTRVRVGPFKTKAQAEQAVEKLKRVSLDGVVSGK